MRRVRCGGSMIDSNNTTEPPDTCRFLNRQLTVSQNDVDHSVTGFNASSNPYVSRFFREEEESLPTYGITRALKPRQTGGPQSYNMHQIYCRHSILDAVLTFRRDCSVVLNELNRIQHLCLSKNIYYIQS